MIRYGTIADFSCSYNPGAINFHICISKTGLPMKTAAKKAKTTTVKKKATTKKKSATKKK